MPISSYMKDLRERIGTRLVLMPAVAAIIHDADGNVLMLRTPSGAWTLPAGAVDPGESPRAAIVRELREETALEVVPTRLLDVFGGIDWRWTYANGDEVEGTVCVFACDVVGGVLRCDGEEIAEAHWVAPGDVPGLLSLPYPAWLFG